MAGIYFEIYDILNFTKNIGEILFYKIMNNSEKENNH
jgi:hypothetical protein